MPIEIGTKQGTTYYSECKRMSSIINPTIDNKVNMRYTGFFDEVDNDNVEFDSFGYGLKKTRANKGLIICNDSSRCFNTSKGYVGMVLSLPEKIVNGVYTKISDSQSYLNEYLLWGINVGIMQPSFPSIYAKLTSQGVEFTIWTIYGKYTLVHNTINISKNTDTFYEFVWDANPMDDFFLNDFDATMALRINNEDVIIGNYPIGTMNLSSLNFCALDTPSNYYNLECTLRRLILGNEVPITVEHEWHSSSTSSSSSADNATYYYDKLAYVDISQEPTVKFVTYTNVDAIDNYLQIVTSSRRFKHLWLPNSSSGNTLSKIDITNTLHPVEVGRYRLATAGDDPSRTVVVPPGDCWVASRQYGTLTKVGLTEASHCRNTCLNTSTGTNEFTYGQDDAVLYYFNIATETMRYPSVAPSNNGIKVRGAADDVNGNIWVEAGENSGKIGTWYKIVGDGGLSYGNVIKYSALSDVGSYGAVCSYNNNYIWSVRLTTYGLTGIDFFSADDPVNTKGSFQHIQTYGIAYARGYIYTGDYSSSPDSTTRRVVRINTNVVSSPNDFPLYTTTFSFKNCPITSYFPRHFVVLVNDDSDVDANRTEDLYINFMGTGTHGYLVVIRNHKQYDDGMNVEIDFNLCEKYVLKDNYTTGIGVMYDVDNKPFVWVLSSQSVNVQAFNPSINELVEFYNGNNYIPLGKSIHYNYTNYTGTVDEATVIPISGTAIYVIDGVVNRWWGRVCLTMDVQSGSELVLSASASNNPNVFPIAVEFDNCEDLSALNLKGRYLRIILQFSRNSQYDPSPTVRDIDIRFME